MEDKEYVVNVIVSYHVVAEDEDESIDIARDLAKQDYGEAFSDEAEYSSEKKWDD
jgi:hypothetical protein